MPTRQRTLVEFSLLIGLVAVVPCRTNSAHAADWPQFMRSAEHTGDATQEALLMPLELAVCVQLDDAVTTSPAVVGGRVYVADQMGTAYCIDPATNRIVWKSSFGRPHRVHRPGLVPPSKLHESPMRSQQRRACPSHKENASARRRDHGY